MGKKDPRIDAYIAQAGSFAQPVLKHLRKLIHQGCPDVEETIKWSRPFFEYKGPFCFFAAFTRHCHFGFWQDLGGVIDEGKSEQARGDLKKIETTADLPSDEVLLQYLRDAVALRDAPKSKTPRTSKSAKPIPALPSDFRAALAKNKKAVAAFEAFPPSHQREYIEWIDGAKREETRSRRIATAVEWIGEGKSQNWRYKK